MKRKYVYYIAVVFLVAFAINFTLGMGLNVWGINKLYKTEKKYRKTSEPDKERLEKQQYQEFYEYKIDSLLEVNPILAIDYIDRVMIKLPNLASLNIDKGIGFSAIDSFQLAHEEFQNAMKKSGYEYPIALYYSGLALANMEKYDEAISEIKKAAERNSAYELDLALIYELKGDYQNAVIHYKKELENVNPVAASIDPETIKDIKALKTRIADLEKLVDE